MKLFFGKYDRSHLFLAISLLTLVTIIWKVSPKTTTPFVQATIVVNAEAIEYLDQRREPKLRVLKFFETIDFPDSAVLQHSDGELLGFNQNVFIKFESVFEVITEGSYAFTIRTDDGFRLLIDGEELDAFTVDRAAEESSIEKILTKGEHRLTLAYFQGYGNASVSLKYSPPLSDKLYPVGQSSKELIFKEYY